MDRFWIEHSYLLYVLVIGLFALVGFLLRKIINSGVSAIDDLYDKYNNHEGRISHIEGQLDVTPKKRRKDD